jgi:L-alanine-DL-glutamate epimerase-like enolase superfamily enzyme
LNNEIYSSYTIGISSAEKIEKKIKDALNYKFLKVKLGTKDDKKIIELINSITDKPLYVDINQGWSDVYFALDIIEWLAEKNVVLIEQPLPKQFVNETKWLKERSPVPIIADEAVQTGDDLESIRDSYSGINVKLMKCGGIIQAKVMIEKANSLGLKTMLGCMTETSCAITAASHLASLADWIDLDGAELISNDLFSGMKIIDGILQIPDLPGIGVTRLGRY